MAAFSASGPDSAAAGADTVPSSGVRWNLDRGAGRTGRGLDRTGVSLAFSLATLLGLSAPAAYAFAGRVSGRSFVSPARAAVPQGGSDQPPLGGPV